VKVECLPEPTRQVPTLEAIFRKWFSKTRDKFHQLVFEITSRVRSVTGATSLTDESDESRKVFYVFSLMFLVFVIFLSPDKILQMITSINSETGMFEKMQEMARLLRKFVPGIG